MPTRSVSRIRSARCRCWCLTTAARCSIPPSSWSISTSWRGGDGGPRAGAGGGGRILPAETKARFEALRFEALADGILDASILQVYEGRYRPPEKHEQKW